MKNECDRQTSVVEPCAVCAQSNASVTFGLRCCWNADERCVLVDCFVCGSSFIGRGEDHDSALADVLESLTVHLAQPGVCLLKSR